MESAVLLGPRRVQVSNCSAVSTTTTTTTTTTTAAATIYLILMESLLICNNGIYRGNSVNKLYPKKRSVRSSVCGRYMVGKELGKELGIWSVRSSVYVW